MSVDDLLKWIPIGVATFAGGGLYINARNLMRSKITEEIRLSESILNDIRDYEDKVEEEKDKIEWGRKFFNTIEWLSFLINNGHIHDEKLVNFFKPAIHAWHRDWFTNESYIEKKVRDDENDYEEFKELHRRFKNEENWKDCECDDCKE